MNAMDRIGLEDPSNRTASHDATDARRVAEVCFPTQARCQMKARVIFSIILLTALLTACGHQNGATARNDPTTAGQAATVVATATSRRAASPVDPCKLLSRDEAATVLDNPGPADPGNWGISSVCKYSRDEDHLELSVDVKPNDKDNMAKFQAIYDPKDVIPLPGVGDVAFEFFQNRDEIRYQSRIIVVLKGSTRFTLNLYRKSGEVGDAFNSKLVAIAKAVADRL